MKRKFTESEVEHLAHDIRRLLVKRGLWKSVTIFFNGVAVSTDDRNGHHAYNDAGKFFVFENEDPRRYCEYAGGVLTMVYDGELYEAINYGMDPKMLREFVSLLSRYGTHYEFGHAWSLSVYPD